MPPCLVPVASITKGDILLPHLTHAKFLAYQQSSMLIKANGHFLLINFIKSANLLSLSNALLMSKAHRLTVESRSIKNSIVLRTAYKAWLQLVFDLNPN